MPASRMIALSLLKESNYLLCSKGLHNATR